MDEVDVATDSVHQRIARALLAVLQPLTGSRATGTILLTAPTGQTVTVERNRAMYPVVQGKARPDLAFKVAEGPTVDGNWVVTDAGAEVTVISIVGGTRHNLVAGTKMLLEPPSAALNADVPELLADATGGLDRTAYGSVRDAVIYETMDGPALQVDMSRSSLKAFPAVVVSWDSTFPQDGPTSQHAAGRARGGEKRYVYSLRYRLSVVSSRVDGDAQRRGEGMAVLNALMLLLMGRQGVDGEALSSPSGVRFMSAQREDGPQDEYKKWYVYNLTVSVETTLETIDTRTYSDWLKTSITVDKP